MGGDVHRARCGSSTRLLKAVREQRGDDLRIGRPWCLPLANRVLLVAVYYRTNLTMRQLAPLFGISPATVCRVIQRLGPVLAIEPVRTKSSATAGSAATGPRTATQPAYPTPLCNTP